MLQSCFKSIFILGNILTICMLPLLIYFSKNRIKYNIKQVYKIFLILSIILFLPIINVIVKNKFIYITSNKEKVSNVVIVQNFNIEENKNEFIDKDKTIEIKNDIIYKIYFYLSYVWIIFSISMFLYYLIVYKIYINKLEIYTEKNEEFEQIINYIKNKNKIKSKINYAFSSKITTPISIGILKKKIVIPIENFNYKDYQYILKHEIFHIKNKDIELKFFLLILNCIYCFNPIVYFLVNQINEILELNCDYNILEKENKNYRIEYGNILLKQIEKNRGKQYKFVMNFAIKRRNIMDRFNNIIDGNKKKKSIIVSVIAIFLIITFILLMIFVPNINIATTDKENNIEINSIMENTSTEESNIENNIEINSIMENTSTEEKNIDNNIEKNNVIENINTIEKTIIEESSNKKIETAIYPADCINPVDGEVGNSFNNYKHTGIDFVAESGTPIKAVASGTVAYSGYKGSYGNMIVISHNDSFQTYYCHCSRLYVNLGQIVNQGEIIAEVGSTGDSTGPHLHFETRMNGNLVNPQNFLH